MWDMLVGRVRWRLDMWRLAEQVVPETVGALLDQMVVLRSQRMKPVPARIDRAGLREFGQQAQRAELAMLASRIAAFAQGMRAMETCAAAIRVAFRLKAKSSSVYLELWRNTSTAGAMNLRRLPPCLLEVHPRYRGAAVQPSKSFQGLR